jgi:hypothetical protein
MKLVVAKVMKFERSMHVSMRLAVAVKKQSKNLRRFANAVVVLTLKKQKHVCDWNLQVR